MVLKKKKSGVFSELKDSVIDYKTLFKAFAKDLLLIIFLLSIFITYMLLVNKSIPNTGITQDNLFSASQSALDNATASLQKFYTIFIILSVIGSLLFLAGITLAKEWIWSGFNKSKPALKPFLKFLSVNIIIYLIAIAISVFLILLSGYFMQMLSNKGASISALQVIAITVLIILSPIILHLINFSSYLFVSGRKFGQAIIGTFKSFRKIKSLLLPYLFILLVFTAVGLLANLVFYLVTSKALTMIFSILFLLILILFLSWEKFYSFIVFERVYK